MWKTFRRNTRRRPAFRANLALPASLPSCRAGYGIIQLKLNGFPGNMCLHINMKQKLFTILGLGIFACAVNAQQPTNSAAPQTTDYSKIFKSDSERDNYAIGMSYGSGLKSNFKSQAPDFNMNPDSLAKGFKDGLSGDSLITEVQAREILANFKKDLQVKAQEKRRQTSEMNKKEGETFLADNKKKDGVKILPVSLPNGNIAELQYKVLTEGSGDSPKQYDTVTVNYRGTLVNGTEFDSSYKRGQPATFPVNGVIKGWTEALQMMKPGSKWQLFIPSELAYGDAGGGPQIGPGATLIFEVELVSLKPGSAPAPSAPLTSDIIKVPSAEEMKKGAKIETIKAEDIPKEQAAQQSKDTGKPKQ
jgi:FKBP-type peptidyl-prolyl cis-trans isomerase FklB